ncbi:hypothetical protein CLAIMM_13773 [Cladophialophora immunda]|nr:hypothetical protein CLAIMM_13773 [Cladophialophora immunda]
MEEAEDAPKTLKTNPQGLARKVLSNESRALAARLAELRDDYHLKIQRADDKAYSHFDRVSAATVFQGQRKPWRNKPYASVNNPKHFRMRRCGSNKE